MPPSAGRRPCDLPPFCRAEFCGARRASLQSAEAAERRRVRIHGYAGHLPAVQDLEPLSGCTTLRAGPSDLVHFWRFPQFLLRITDQATTPHAYFSDVIVSAHA